MSDPSSVLDPAPPATLADDVLIDRLIGGSEDAVEALYDRHANAVFAAALRVTSDRQVAADVLQETFLALWNRAELFDPSRGALVSWLTTIARNRAIDHIRSASRHDRALTFSSFGDGWTDPGDGSIAEWLTSAGTLIGAADPDRPPDVALADKERSETLERAIAALPPLERQVIRLAYGTGLTQAEIAERLGWPLGTVKTRTRRALQQLRRHVEPILNGAGT